MLLPWNGGASSRRRWRWASRSSAKTEPEPSRRLRLGWMLPSSSGLVVNICLASCGSQTTTIRPYIGRLSMKTSPWRRASRLIIRRRDVAKPMAWNNFGNRVAGGNLTAGAVDGAVATSLMALMLPTSAPNPGGGTTVYRRPFPVRYSVVPNLTRVPYPPKGAPAVTSAVTAAADDAVLGEDDPFRLRLLDGLGTSIGERGYRATTVADKEECFLELLGADVEKLAERIAAAVDPEADWHQQIRQAVEAYVGHIESRPALTLSWIRELPSLGTAARPSQRRGLTLLSTLLIDLSASPGFKRANLPPLTAPLAVILVGGLRELTALAVEDGRPVREIVEPAVDASVALLGPRH